MEIQELATEIEKIKLRNKRVETAKAWETSKTRIFSTAFLTYVAMCILMFTLRVDNPLLNAIIPTCGFLLSTISLPIIKNWWIARYKN